MERRKSEKLWAALRVMFDTHKPHSFFWLTRQPRCDGHSSLMKKALASWDVWKMSFAVETGKAETNPASPTAQTLHASLLEQGLPRQGTA